jgi:type IV pilus assembly protein PilF
MPLSPRRLIPFALAALVVLAGCSTTTSTPVGLGHPHPRRTAMFETEIAVAYLQHGNRTGALNAVHRALHFDPRLVSALDVLALLDEELGRLPAARKTYRRALSVSPHDPNTLNDYGAFLCRIGEEHAAVRRFLEAAHNPAYRTPQAAYTNAAVCALKANDRVEADHALRRALSLDPDFAPALWQVARLERKAGDDTAAARHLARFVDLEPRPAAAALWTLIRLERRLGHPRLAARYGAELLRLYPGSPEARRYLRTEGS